MTKQKTGFVLATFILSTIFQFSCGTQNIGLDKKIKSNATSNNMILKVKVEFPDNINSGLSIKDQTVGLGGGTLTLKYPPDHPTKPNQVITTIATNINSDRFYLELGASSYPGLTFEIPIGVEFNNLILTDTLILESSNRILNKNNKVITLRTYVKPSHYSQGRIYSSWDSIIGSSYVPSLNGTNLRNQIVINHETTALAIRAKYKKVKSNDILDLISSSQLPNVANYSDAVNLVQMALQNQEDPMSVIKYNESSDTLYYDKTYVNNRILNDHECKGCMLLGQSFDNINFPNVDFKKANFSGSSFSNANFSNDSFQESKLVNTKFINSEIYKSSFNFTILDKTDFSGSIISNSKFSDILSYYFLPNSTHSLFYSGAVNFEGALLNSVNIENSLVPINFKNSKIDNLTYTNPIYHIEPIIINATQTINATPGTYLANFTKSEITNSSFSKIIFRGGSFYKSKITDTSFFKTYFAIFNSPFVFNKSELTRVKFNSSYLFVNMDNSEIKDSEFSDTKISSGTFNGANFSNTKFTNCDFLGVNASNTKISNSTFINNRSINLNLTSAIINDSSLSGNDLSTGNFSSAIITNVDLSNTNLRNSYLRGAVLNNVKLEGADLSGSTWTDGRTCAEGSIGVCK